MCGKKSGKKEKVVLETQKALTFSFILGKI
jgi:hypothetical protein